MDWVKITENAGDYIKKYRYLVLVLLAGILLMMIPESAETEKAVQIKEEVKQESQERSLEKILSLIDGAGRVSVLLTEKKGQEILYQIDEDISTGENTRDAHRKTVITTDTSRQETGLVRQINPPELLGAVVLCQGANDPKIKLAVVEAVMRATGLPSNCICVLKMK